MRLIKDARQLLAGPDEPSHHEVHRLACELLAEVEALRAALSDLLDCQNGPPLLQERHRKAWEQAVAEARRLLP